MKKFNKIVQIMPCITGLYTEVNGVEWPVVAIALYKDGSTQALIAHEDGSLVDASIFRGWQGTGYRGLGKYNNDD